MPKVILFRTVSIVIMFTMLQQADAGCCGTGCCDPTCCNNLGTCTYQDENGVTKAEAAMCVAGKCGGNDATGYDLAEASTPAGTFQFACGAGFTLKADPATITLVGADAATKKATCCRAPANVDCVEGGNTAADCLSTCAVAVAVVKTAQSGTGAACVGDHKCVAGEGACPANVDTATNTTLNTTGKAQTKTLTITMNLDGIDLSTLDAEGFAAINKATEEMAAAQGIDMKDVSEIIYKQNGKVVKAPTASSKNRRASGDITMEFVFKAGAVVDVDVLVKKLATAIEKNEVKFSVEIDGKKIEAKGFAAAAVDVDVKSGIVKSGASTTGIATGLIAMLATVAAYSVLF